ncbi:MAG TPA: radical SAM protein [Verrucomicrobiae bacterium]
MNSVLEAPNDVSTNPATKHHAAFGYPRDFLNNRFVYLVVSPRARGLSIGINLNPDKRCDFDCIYCEVDRRTVEPGLHLDVSQLAEEFRSTLAFVMAGKVAERPYFQRMPRELLTLRHVTLSGDGEPTLCPQFCEVVETAIHFRAMDRRSAFKLVLLTNGSGLDRDPVTAGLRYFTMHDEIWCKLDGGSTAYLTKVNQPLIPLQQSFENILNVAKRRPVTIQSLFPSIDGAGPGQEEIEAYVQRLVELQAGGAKISSVQIYSATRPMHNEDCGHLPLRTLSKIAQLVRQRTGMPCEVF